LSAKEYASLLPSPPFRRQQEQKREGFDQSKKTAGGITLLSRSRPQHRGSIEKK
jgi:hypothetical protein